MNELEIKYFTDGIVRLLVHKARDLVEECSSTYRYGVVQEKLKELGDLRQLLENLEESGKHEIE